MLGITSTKNELDRSLSLLKRSRLMRHSEYKHMFDMIYKYNHDSNLSSLVGKDQQQLHYQAQDSQFFKILAKMLTEVTSIKNTLKQREDLKRVYRWYIANRSVLHCLPHFGHAKPKMGSQQAVLRFAPDAIAHYSSSHRPSPRQQEKENSYQNLINKNKRATVDDGTHTNDKNAEEREQSVQETFVQSPRKTEMKRPKTAPPTLYSRQRTLGKVNKESFQESSFTGQYVVKNLVENKKRPASAVSIMRMSCKSPYSDETKVNIFHKEEEERPGTAASTMSSISIRLPSTNETLLASPRRPQVVPKGMTVAEVINPTAQISLDEDYDTTGSIPDTRSMSPVRMLHVNVPTDDDNVPSKGDLNYVEDQKSTNLKAWEEFKQKQNYGQDFIGRLLFYGRSGTPHGIRYSAHDDAERPELYSEDVIASYAEFMEENAPRTTERDCDKITYKSLENFYKETERYCMDPKQRTQIAPVKIQPKPSTPDQQVAVYVPDELSQDVRIRTAMENSMKNPTVQFDTLVNLTEMVKEDMEHDKERLSPSPKFGYHQPAIAVTKRPSTAPERIMSTPVPPNSDRPSSARCFYRSGLKLNFSPQSVHFSLHCDSKYGCYPLTKYTHVSTSSEGSSRNLKGEPVVLLPEKTDYTMHLRKDANSHREGNLKHYMKCSGNVQPDTTRYRWTNDGFGNYTHIKVLRRPESGCKTQRSLRTAGSVSGGRRPTTSPVKQKWSTDNKEEEVNERIIQAASHTTTQVRPATVSKMVVVHHLGSEQTRRSKSRMGHRIAGSVASHNELPRFPPSLQFLSFTGPAKIKVKGQEDAGLLPEAPPQSPKECHSGGTSISSGREMSFNSQFGSGQSSPVPFNLEETPRQDETPGVRPEDGKLTPIQAHFKLRGQAIKPTLQKITYQDPEDTGQNSDGRNLVSETRMGEGKELEANIQIVWDSNNSNVFTNSGEKDGEMDIEKLATSIESDVQNKGACQHDEANHESIAENNNIQIGNERDDESNSIIVEQTLLTDDVRDDHQQGNAKEND